MTGWTDERIPIGVLPAPGEALDSWLERYAYRLKINILDFVDYLGLPHTSARKMVRRFTDDERDVLQRRTGIGTEQLTAMTLSRTTAPSYESTRRGACGVRPPGGTTATPHGTARHTWRRTKRGGRCAGASAGLSPAPGTNCYCSTTAPSVGTPHPWPASAGTASCRGRRPAGPGSFSGVRTFAATFPLPRRRRSGCPKTGRSSRLSTRWTPSCSPTIATLRPDSAAASCASWDAGPCAVSTRGWTQRQQSSAKSWTSTAGPGHGSPPSKKCTTRTTSPLARPWPSSQPTLNIPAARSCSRGFTALPGGP